MLKNAAAILSKEPPPMARKPRLYVDEEIYHVMRGNGGRAIYTAKGATSFIAVTTGAYWAMIDLHCVFEHARDRPETRYPGHADSNGMPGVQTYRENVGPRGPKARNVRGAIRGRVAAAAAWQVTLTEVAKRLDRDRTTLSRGVWQLGLSRKALRHWRRD